MADKNFWEREPRDEDRLEIFDLLEKYRYLLIEGDRLSEMANSVDLGNSLKIMKVKNSRSKILSIIETLEQKLNNPGDTQ